MTSTRQLRRTADNTPMDRRVLDRRTGDDHEAWMQATFIANRRKAQQRSGKDRRKSIWKP